MVLELLSRRVWSLQSRHRVCKALKEPCTLDDVPDAAMAESDTVPIKTHLQSYPNSTSLLDPPSAGKAGGLSDARNAAEIPQACEQIVEVVFDLRYKWSGTTVRLDLRRHASEALLIFALHPSTLQV